MEKWEGEIADPCLTLEIRVFTLEKLNPHFPAAWSKQALTEIGARGMYLSIKSQCSDSRETGRNN